VRVEGGDGVVGLGSLLVGAAGHATARGRDGAELCFSLHFYCGGFLAVVHDVAVSAVAVGDPQSAQAQSLQTLPREVGGVGVEGDWLYVWESKRVVIVVDLLREDETWLYVCHLGLGA